MTSVVDATVAHRAVVEIVLSMQNAGAAASGGRKTHRRRNAERSKTKRLSYVGKPRQEN